MNTSELEDWQAFKDVHNSSGNHKQPDLTFISEYNETNNHENIVANLLNKYQKLGCNIKFNFLDSHLDFFLIILETTVKNKEAKT